MMLELWKDRQWKLVRFSEWCQICEWFYRIRDVRYALMIDELNDVMDEAQD